LREGVSITGRLGELSMPRVLQGDKFYPWLVGGVLALIIADILLIWSLF
jgi:hypothetical protein